MNIPETIPFGLIDLGERGRTTYSAIEELAESIEHNGLIQPIVIEPVADRYLLRAGGRRYHALRLLEVETLYHGTSSDPARPGFLLANVEADTLRGLLIEIAENHDRADIDWRDDLKLMVKAYHLWENSQWAAGERPLQRQFGAMCNVSYMNLKHGLVIFEDLLENPDVYADCTSIKMAYSKKLKLNAEFVAKLAAQKSFAHVPAFKKSDEKILEVKGAETPSQEIADLSVIPISNQLYHGNGLDFLAQCDSNAFDHIVTDPDFALPIETLDSGASGNFAAGVFQTSAEESWKDLQRFVQESFRVTQHFCVFWYDLDYHERLKDLATSVGWCVQRWPLIWDRTDHRGNGAPNHNFCKHIEYAMVLRKPQTTLAQVQMRCIFSCPGNDTVRRFGHPFAKPIELWDWIYRAVAIKGQTVCDPFAGKGSAPFAAIKAGLKPFACEINDQHFSDLTLNMQGAYREVIGTNIAFK